MSWYAKPSGAFYFDSYEGSSNTIEIGWFFADRGYSLACQAGIAGNVMAESGLNPWRWQSDTVNYQGGYGLFQYTPASSYIDGATAIPYYAPNLSTTSITPGSNPNDAIAQLDVFDRNLLGKWIRGCWRSYWDPSDYPDLYQASQRILAQYGTDGRLSMTQFMLIDDLWDATFAFLACFEGPAVPNMGPRYNNAALAYKIISGSDPPDPPDPPTPYRKKMPIWFGLRQF